MSSPAVRSAVETRWAQAMAGAGLTVPFFRTADDRQPGTGLPDLWATAVYEVTARGPTTMGSRPYFEEVGIVTIVAYGRSGGQGDLPRQAIEAVVPYLAKYDASVDLAFTNAVGPTEMDPDMEGEFYPVQVVATYTLQERP